MDTGRMVKTVRPESYGDVFYVGHYFREGVAVVMDLTALSNADAVPLVDFAAGLIVGRGGFMERIATKDCRVSYGPVGERAILPQADEILRTARELVKSRKR